MISLIDMHAILLFRDEIIFTEEYIQIVFDGAEA